ncbi:outer membrane lipoprotein-sorting protein [Reinekea blandensis]|uniref:Uncharacterized protein TP-0789 domain-containing protein n=1 Tax=Reinekea blandensis MED297 TaxID=314283 RepID=A4BKL6_9GAMM|nr:outer membrane lipoprotein-sorting protein [Reinekea blandensis]EAR07327.1 hypothetical protein MED297_18041 [Reinekea sp. MED297] [Reinekea blandensis MED297]
MSKVLFAGVLSAALVAGAALAESDPEAVELLEKVDNLYQQDNSYAVMTMDIQTPDFERSMTLESWSIGLDYSLVRVLEPKKEEGVATLKREDDMWNYLPKIRKVLKVPPSMMMGSWMGSDFTNDDLMREGSWVEEFDVTLSETEDLYTLDLNAKPETVTVWGQMQIDIDTESLLPVSQRYFDEDGTLMREMLFKEVKTFDGVTLPSVMELNPLNKPGHQTRVTYQEMSFDVDIDEDFFTLQNLRRSR